MERIVKLTVSEFIEKVKSLSIGEYFDFATNAEHVSVPQSEEELSEWHGVQKICLFDNEMCVVSRYGGPGCRAFSTDDDYLTFAVKDIFYNVLFTDWVYVVEKSEKQMPSVTLTADNCLDISGCCEDIKGKIEEMDNIADFSEDEIRQIAEEVIDRRDDCDLIYEIYWQIVEETIEKFSAKKTVV
ncbi:MAG: hypothetical protein K1W18_07220 [Oscillospiraceae bacterium]